MNNDLSNETKISPIRKKRNLFWLWIVVTAIVAGGAVGAFAYRGVIKDIFSGKSSEKTETSTDATKSTATSDSIATSTDTSSDSTPAAAATTKIVDASVTWLNPRVKLADLGLFKGVAQTDGPGSGYTGTDYYKVATMSDGGEIILAQAKVEELGTFYDFHHFLKKDNIYFWLSQNSDKVGGGGDINYYTRTNTETNSILALSSLLPDKKITQGSTVLTQDSSSSRDTTFADSSSVGTKALETKWGDLYLLKGKDIDKSNGDAKVAQYYLLRNDGIKLLYTPQPGFRLDDGTFNITWSNTAGQGQKFSQITTSGCGGGGGSFPLITDDESLKTKTEVGQSADGSKIYTVGAGTTLAEFGYQVYLLDGASGKVAKDIFLNNLGILAWQDSLGNWIAYLNNNYSPAMECGKPVIYLYPEKDTRVSVKVGANIRKSEPNYAGGWDVLAKKNGEFVLNGVTYPYLFWEGKGFGTYPSITNGTIVKQPDAPTTISQQLSTMGLNSKEIADFNEFWLPRLPKTPFIRLTWLTNKEMNELAPLQVTPKPDSIIRVFLDFEGFDHAVSIPSQTLPKYERKGFTLVEWGGLLRGGD